MAFHPYYQITDAPRDEWRVHLAAGLALHAVESAGFSAPGEQKPIDLPEPLPLAGHQLDDVYGGSEGRRLVPQGGRRDRQKISIRFGPKYKVAVVYAPPGREFICFEPMSGITNAFNLNQVCLCPECEPSPGQTWRESL